MTPSPPLSDAALAAFDAGTRCLGAGDAAGAEAALRRAIELAPEFAEAHANLAFALEDAGRPEAAEACYRRAIALAPQLSRIRHNFGALLTAQRRYAEAEAVYREALALDPGAVAGWSNLGVVLAAVHREAEAEACQREALRRDPDYRNAAFNLAYVLLRQGRYEEGWARFEARDWYGALETRLGLPRWNGEPLAGRSLLVGFEAGHGDMIQFCRYLPLLKARGLATLSLLCHPGLVPLLAGLEGVDEVIGFDRELPPRRWDCWTPLLSLPFHFATRLDSIPARLPYLAAPADRLALWRERLAAAGSGLRVGLVWKGNPRFENDVERSFGALAELDALAALPGLRWFSLQLGAGAGEAAAAAGRPAALAPLDLAPQIADFADTAAIVAQLDLVISVDTAVAHLAGALGRPCWILLPDRLADWRWLARRSDSPWYPDVVRLFRKPAPGGWDEVVAAVAAALRQRLAATGA